MWIKILWLKKGKKKLKIVELFLISWKFQLRLCSSESEGAINSGYTFYCVIPRIQFSCRKVPSREIFYDDIKKREKILCTFIIRESACQRSKINFSCARKMCWEWSLTILLHWILMSLWMLFNILSRVHNCCHYLSTSSLQQGSVAVAFIIFIGKHVEHPLTLHQCDLHCKL